MKWQDDPVIGRPQVKFRIGGPSAEDLARQAMNEALIVPGISDAIKDYLRAEAAAHRLPPKIIHHPIDDKLQTGDSQGLGGGMEVKAPWKRD